MKPLSPTPNGKRIDLVIHQTLMRVGMKLWPVYYQLVSDIGKGADGFTNGRLAATLHMPRRTLQRHLSVLRCMGLVAPIQTNSRRGFERIGVRYRLDSITTKLMERLCDGRIKIDSRQGCLMRGTTRVDHSEKLMALAQMICVRPEILKADPEEFARHGWPATPDRLSAIGGAQAPTFAIETGVFEIPEALYNNYSSKSTYNTQSSTNNKSTSTRTCNNQSHNT